MTDAGFPPGIPPRTALSSLRPPPPHMHGSMMGPPPQGFHPQVSSGCYKNNLVK